MVFFFYFLGKHKINTNTVMNLFINFYLIVDLPLEVLNSPQPPRKQPKITTGPVGIFPKEKNPFGSAVIDNFSLRQTDR